MMENSALLWIGGASAIIWLGLGLYLGFLASRQRTLTRRLQQLEILRHEPDE